MFPLLLGTQQIWDIKEGENADNLGPMAWLFLQENVQVQYLQKIALRAENPFGPKWSHYLDMLYFPHVVRFSVAIEATIFRAHRLMLAAIKGRGPIHGDGLSRMYTILLKPNVSNPFSPSCQSFFIKPLFL